MARVWLWQLWILLNYMEDNQRIFSMLAVSISIKTKKQNLEFSSSGGVKEEQVLDAFKILFNDNQVIHLLDTHPPSISFDCRL